MKQLSVTTNTKRQVVDITDEISKQLPQGEGSLLVFVAHTTAAITAMDLDPGTDLDLLDALDKLIPNLNWRHPHDPSHTPDHLLASIIGPDILIPYRDETLLLGTWQRVVLLEFDGPRERTVTIA